MQFSETEIQWLLAGRTHRLFDNHEVLIYPMGSERYLSTVLFSKKINQFSFRQYIEGKRVLVIPGYGNTGFLFAQANASVTVYDKDPVTIAWLKAFKTFYHYRGNQHKNTIYPSIGECLDALTSWYPPHLKLPMHAFENLIYWLIHPQFLRRAYIFYMISLVQEAIKTEVQDQFMLNKPIRFYAGELDQLLALKKKPKFDTVYIPYLLGVRNGIEHETNIIDFMNKIYSLVPNGTILVTPSNNTREFYIMGQRYFETTAYKSLEQLPGLSSHIVHVEKNWFRTQGLTVMTPTGFVS